MAEWPLPDPGLGGWLGPAGPPPRPGSGAATAARWPGGDLGRRAGHRGRAGRSRGPGFALGMGRGAVFKKRSSLVFSGGDKHMDTLKLISHPESLDHNIVIPKMPFGIYLQSKAAFLCHLMGERGRCSTTLTI